ncbi:TPA: hypothetical protein L7578_002055 [Klebsiella pneumoniae subsp. pneumoniae]|nr:hypothetical protein [Klebsiella pneumoniae subsp. pneumoniae]HBW7978849.1 hypothetical protein [Klebsiella pneumoniae]HBW8116353.1 hypothetical protein [Klebsiella pneumoniae]
MKNEVEQIALQNDMSIEFVTWFFNEKKVGCGNVWFMMMAAMWEGWKGRSIEMDKLAAENVALKAEQVRIFNSGYMRGHESTVEGFYVDIHQDDITTYHEDVVAEISEEQTPATDAYLAGIKADAITASLDACSDYLDTDCVMDRLDISYEDAEKRTSGAIEFHDAMVDFANQVREGADK